MATTGPSQTTSDKGAEKIKKGKAPRIQRDNDTDHVSNAETHNKATRQESRDRDEHKHFHAADAQDIKRSQSSARAQKREKGWEDNRDHGENRRDARGADDNYSPDNYHHNSAYLSSNGASDVRAAGHRYQQMGHGANRRPDDGYGDAISEVDSRYLGDRRGNDDRREDRWREESRYNDRGHYDGNRAERDRYELNDRQNGWQANVRVDNRGDDRRHPDDRHFHNNWRDQQWRETASRSDRHQWRPNDDERNEQRNGSEYDRDRGSYGNSRFRDDDYGYRTSRHDSDQYRGDYSREDERNYPQQPRGYSATSERDYDDRNPSHDRNRNRYR